MIEDILTEMITEFNKRAESDQKVRDDLANVVRTIQITLDDGRSFHFVLADSRVGELKTGPADGADIVIESSEETIGAIRRKELRAMKALATKRVRINARLEDIIRLRKFF